MDDEHRIVEVIVPRVPIEIFEAHDDLARFLDTKHRNMAGRAGDIAEFGVRTVLGIEKVQGPVRRRVSAVVPPVDAAAVPGIGCLKETDIGSRFEYGAICHGDAVA